MAVANPLDQLDLAELRQRTSTKWREYDADVLPLWVAEMDVPLADAVRDRLERAVLSGDTGYADAGRYAAAFASFAADRWGWTGLAPERAVPVADVMRGVVEAIGVLTGTGATVVVDAPVYPPFHTFLRAAGREVLEAPLGEGGRLDLEALERAFASAAAGGRGAAYLLCSPHNPTGVVHTPAELSGVAALAAEHGVRVVADEIHAPLVLPGATFTPYLSVPGTEAAMAVVSASKGWNLAGVKAALLVAGVEAAGDLARLPEVVSHGPSHFGVIAQTAALDEGRDWLDALLAGLQDNRRLLGELLVAHLPDVRWVPPEATYLAWLDCRALGLGPDPAAAYLERARVALSAGGPFGTGGEGHVRLNFATSPAVLTEAVARMGRVVTS